MDNKPYLISGVIGNSKMLVSLGERGEVYRIFWPRIDYAQNLYKMHAGVFHHGEINWLDMNPFEQEQVYLENSNIIQTKAHHPHWNLTVETLDYVHPEKDIFVRNYTFVNRDVNPRNFDFFLFSDFHIEQSTLYHTTKYNEKYDSVLCYRRNICFALGADHKIDSYQCGEAYEGATYGFLNGAGHCMSTDHTFKIAIGDIPPGGKKEFAVFICAAPGRQEALENLEWARNQGSVQLKKDTVKFWDAHLDKGKKLSFSNTEWEALYKRSLLVFPLMTDATEGSMIAAPEFDEKYRMSGGYAYCWGRDAAFIATALDAAGYHKDTERFYQWCQRVQEVDGSWEQRYYLDGNIAPNWGLQIDETGSVLWGMWQHYEVTKQKGFLEDVWPSVKKAMGFLIDFMDSDTGLPEPSMDLWEERKGVHTYSSAAVWGGILGSSLIAKHLGHDKEALEWQELADSVKRAVIENLENTLEIGFNRGIKMKVSEWEYQCRVDGGDRGYCTVDNRGFRTFVIDQDKRVDISMIGLVYPFKLYDNHHPHIKKLVESVRERLWSPKVGGIMRYAEDCYIGGNPWILTTLWLALYYIESGDYSQAKGLVQWAVSHQTKLGLLPEQVDKETGEPAWVIPLTWSHAMYVLAINALADRNQL